MTKLIVAAICAATLFASRATAEELVGGPARGAQPRPAVAAQYPNQEAIQEALFCKARNSCGVLSDQERARAAMALLFLRISENCNRNPCALRLAKVR